MPSLVQALAQSAQKDVQIGILHYRIRAVSSAELIEAGASFLLAARPDPDPTAPPKPPDPKAVIEKTRFDAAIVAAGLVAGSKDGKVWEELKITLQPHQENPSQGRLFIGRLPPQHTTKLASEILTLSTDGGAASERLSSFLGSPAAPAS